MTGGNTLLDVNNLKVHFHIEQGTVRAVDGVSFDIKRGCSARKFIISPAMSTSAGQIIVQFLQFRQYDKCSLIFLLDAPD